MSLQKGALALIDYTAKVKDTEEVFETTKEDVAKSNSIYDAYIKYQPRMVAVGEAWVLKGLDDSLLNANVGDEFNVEVPPDKAFGERDSGKVRMMPIRKLGEDAEKVSVGDTVQIDERTGIIRYMGSGRVQVDFNHRLAGKTILYDVKVLKALEKDEEKIEEFLKRRIPVDNSKIQFTLKSNVLDIPLPEEAFLLKDLQVIKRAITNEMFKYVPSLEKINFIETYPNKKAESSSQGGKATQAKATASSGSSSTTSSENASSDESSKEETKSVETTTTTGSSSSNS